MGGSTFFADGYAPFSVHPVVVVVALDRSHRGDQVLQRIVGSLVILDPDGAQWGRHSRIDDGLEGLTPIHHDEYASSQTLAAPSTTSRTSIHPQS